MKRFITLALILLVVSCVPYHYPLFAEKLYQGLHEYMEDGVIYGCETDYERIEYCSFSETDDGFKFDFYDSSMITMFSVVRSHTITAHGKLELQYVAVDIGSTRITVHY